MEWYEIVALIVSVLSLLGFGTIMQMFWKDRHDKRKQNTEEAKKQAKEERQDEIREVIKEEIKPIDEKITELDKQARLNSVGTQAGLRNDLLNCYYNCSKKGYRTNEDIMNWQDMLTAYYDLGGNSFIVELNKIMENIDSEEKYLAKKKAKKKTTTKKKKVLVESKGEN